MLSTPSRNSPVTSNEETFLLFFSLIRKVNDSVKRKITKSIKIAIDTKIEEAVSSHAKVLYISH